MRTSLYEALKSNPFDLKKGDPNAYIRYLRYTVAGFYNLSSQEVRKLWQEAQPNIKELFEGVKCEIIIYKDNNVLVDTLLEPFKVFEDDPMATTYYYNFKFKCIKKEIMKDDISIHDGDDT